MRHLHRKAICLGLFLSGLIGLPTQAADSPNIVYMMADELGYYELSCMGNPNIQTPNIDQMAAEGIRFTQLLAGSSVCAPTRCCLMTGKHSGHTSVRLNGGGTPMRAGEDTVASLLKTKGYATGGFGKWGCGGRGSTGVPEQHGFDVFLGYYDQVHAHSYYPPYIVRNSEEVPLADNHGVSNGKTYSHYVIFEGGINFIKENKDKPFFCYLPITPPHGIFDIPDSDPAWQLYKDKDWPEQAKRYAAMVSMVDRNLGEVIALLKELSLEENTLVIFCGDNGGNDYFKDKDHPRGFHNANKHPQTGVEFRGTKGTLYEGGLRIPFIARWPGKIAPGRVSDHLGYFPDVLPTVCEVAGVKVPDDIDGISFVPELFGHGEQTQHEYLYWEINNQTAVRMGTWKAYRRRPEAKWELYDLESDVSESKDIAAEHSDVLRKLIRFANEAHEPVQEGTFHNPDIHQRDRQAKFGFDNPQPLRQRRGKKMSALPQKGLIPNKNWKIVSVSSEAKGNRKLAQNAIDGDPGTWWHTQFSPEVMKHPHELVIDLGAEYDVRGFRYLARQDAGWNGALQDCDFQLGLSPNSFSSRTVAATFKKTKDPQEVTCRPTTARYIKLTIRSEVNDGPWASIAELGVVGE